jgi:cytoskeleton protein RodZ
MEDPAKKIEKADNSKRTLTEADSDLKSLRTSKGLTLKDIFEYTRISVIILEAIEKGDFHALPPPVVTKAFIKTYATKIGADSSKILARYEQYLETLTPSSHQIGDIKTTPQTAGKRYKYILWGLSILLTVGIIAVSIVSYKSDVDIPKSQIDRPIYPTSEAKPPEATGMTAEVKGQSAGQTGLIAKPEERKPPLKKTSQSDQLSNAPAERVDVSQGVTIKEVKKQDIAAGEIHRLTMEAKELTWIRITADQDLPEEILLKPGERIERSASSFVIDIGNAGGIDVDFQGRPLGNLGKHGQVVHLKLP